MTDDRKILLLSGVTFLALACPGIAAAQARDGVAGGPPQAATDPALHGADATEVAAADGDIVVTGIRGSLNAALNTKRNADQIVDAISAVDIGKLPDANMADALQRVTGIQLTRSFGEGSRVNIRGLQSVRIEVNGRAVYTTGLESTPGNSNGRNASMEQLASGMFGKIEVFKSPVASQIEGGLGGVINAETYKPSDFRKPTFVISAEGSRGNLAGKGGYTLSGLASTTVFDGKLGFVLNASYQDTPLGYDSIARQSWNEAPPGSDLNGDGKRDLRANNVRGEFFRVGRKRLSLAGNITYAPNSDLEIFLDGTYAHLKTERNTRFIFANIGNAAILDPVFSGNYIVAGTVTGQPLVTGGIDRSEPTSVREFAGGARWSTPLVTLKGEVAFSQSNFDQSQHYFEMATIRSMPTRFDFRENPIPVFEPSDSLDLGILSNFRTNNFFRQRLERVTKERSARLDSEWQVGSWLSNIKAGLRYARVTFDQTGYLTNFNSPGEPTPPQPGAAPDAFVDQDWNFFRGASSGFPRDFLIVDYGALVRADPRLFPQTPLRLVPSQKAYIAETTWAAYLEANAESEFFGIPFRGNLGVRVIGTRSTIDSQQLATSSAGVTTATPRRDKNSYTDVLPSANIAFELNDKLLLRLSAAKVMARQDFAQLAPAYIGTASSTPATVTGGNADLLPTRARQADMSLEWYFAPSSFLSGALFYKNATGFAVNGVTTQVVAGFESLGEVQFTRPFNSGRSKIKGIELNYQHSFTFLPGALSGLGVISSFTYSDGKTNTGDPVVDLSKTSYNITGFFEKYGINARVSYVWRSKRLFNFLSGTGGPDGTGRRNSFVGPAGTLDASLGYDVTSNINIYVSGSNLLFRKGAIDYYNVIPAAQTRYDLNERRFSIGVRGKF